MSKKKRHITLADGKRPANHILISKIADRLEGLGFKPFRSEAERYLVTAPEDGTRPELLEIGRASKGGRFFRNNFVGRDMKLIKQFGEFAKGGGLSDCYFWNVSLTGCKARVSTLVADVERFNADINQHFTELRKKHHFELLSLTLHFRYDENQHAIDLHAHFVCRVPVADLLETQAYLRAKFSLPYLETTPIENAEAVLNYMLFGIFDNCEMVDWPDDALAAVWQMTQQKRYRYVRTGGSFARWRKERQSANDNVPGHQRPRKPAYVTAPGQSRFLARVMAKVRGKRVRAFLYERPVDNQYCPDADMVYSTASRRTTQDLGTTSTPLLESIIVRYADGKTPLQAFGEALWRVPKKIICKLIQLKNAAVSRLRV
ncbi:hypothetical protein [Rhizobium rhizogenes]|jgi:hypothetical protein|uniref:hypothetical protein n=1 Tax=Rhizobium rhizogenes TaxID=359 RepID=UPI0015745FBD|nr:hypothetical protein [Rhizobium rhizogenes]NTG42971.1 hypothetical protein [Rhizobium rhizogenes]